MNFNNNDNNDNNNNFSSMNLEYKLAKFKIKSVKKFKNNFDLLNTTLFQDLSTKNKTDIKNSNSNNLSNNKNNIFDSSNSLIDNNIIIKKKIKNHIFFENKKNIKNVYNNNNNNNNINNNNNNNNLKHIQINNINNIKVIEKSKSSFIINKIKEIKFNILKSNTEFKKKKNIFNLKKVPLLKSIQKFRNTNNLNINNLQNNTELYKRDYLYEENLKNLNKFFQTNNNSKLYETNYNINKSLTPIKNKNEIPESFQYFNSSSAKNLFYENKNNFNKIGPGYYNITKYKSIMPQKEKKIHFTKKNINNNNDNNINNNYNISPGPGWYNISKNFIKKSFSSENIFSQEIRFKNIKISPGPGEYNINNNYNNKKNYQNKYKPIFRKIINDKENIIKRNSFNKSLNNHYINYSFSTIDNSHTIQFNLLKKLFNKNYKNAPFGSCEEKKYSYINSTNNNLGGFYQNDLFKTKVKNNNVSYFFKNNENNKINNNNKLRFVAPHSYYKDSYFNWNKKSFNVNYNDF